MAVRYLEIFRPTIPARPGPEPAQFQYFSEFISAVRCRSSLACNRTRVTSRFNASIAATLAGPVPNSPAAITKRQSTP